MNENEILAAVWEVHKGRISTHYTDCWKYHAGCLAAVLIDIRKESRGKSGSKNSAPDDTA